MKSVRTALINIRRMPYKSLLAILIITLTFFLSYSFSLLTLGSEAILQHFESQPKVIAFFEIETEANQVKQIAETVQSYDFVKEVKVDSKQEALEYYQENQDNPLLLELVSADILPASLEISAISPSDLTKIKKNLQNFDEIDDVVLYKEVIDSLNQWTKSIRLIGLFTLASMTIVSLMVIATIVSFKISHKKRAISILRIIGAGSGYIITPFIYEGFIYGLTGSILGWAGMYAGFLYITPWLSQFLGQIIDLPLPWQFFALQLGLGSTIALFLGGAASIIAAKKFIKY
ncbi:MAG: permease-like cell division protein FtsX [Patescibacteria group bacterium]|nr:permease-like cell division protein FtsX [Patescibacteria group bacterium]